MQIGVVTMDGRQVGVVSWTQGDDADTFTPDLSGYEPMGRASERSMEGAAPSVGARPHDHHTGGHGGSPRRHGPNGHGAPHHHDATPRKPKPRFGGEGDLDPPVQSHKGGGYQPSGKAYTGAGGHPVHHGSAEVDQAIVDAAKAHHLDPNFMRSIASIESGMNPGSNANRPTQYKGLYQIGARGSGSEWSRFGQGNIYSARDNAFAAARMFAANRDQFKKKFGRDPTDTEMYLMHQQGLGFYTRGAMTNIKGNPYPGMRGGQNHESFEAGWGREVARRKAQFATKNAKVAEEKPPADVKFDPDTMAP